MSNLERLTANNVALETILNKVLEYNENIVTFDPAEHMTYDGQKTILDDGNGNWRVKFLTSGQVTFTEDPGPIDVFCVGGGGGGGIYAGGGGAGGKTSLWSDMSLQNLSYEITIGAGGNGSTSISSAGTTGGTTTAFGVSATGGTGGNSFSNSPTRKGGNGGSGGGAGGNTTPGAGGTNGGDGGSGDAEGTITTGGTGQGTTTREFHEASGTLYSTGGQGGGGSTSGVGGGNTSNGIAGGTNTGGGGGGYKDAQGTGGAGGSGIVIIRNHRESSGNKEASGTYLFKIGEGALVDFTTSLEDSQCYANIGTESISLGWQTNDRTVACRISSKINISEYKTLKLDYTCTENKTGSDYYEAFGISSSAFSSGSTTVNALNMARTEVSISSERRIDTLDISGLSGEYYIGIYGAGKIEVYNLWLE